MEEAREVDIEVYTGVAQVTDILFKETRSVCAELVVFIFALTRVYLTEKKFKKTVTENSVCIIQILQNSASILFIQLAIVGASSLFLKQKYMEKKFLFLFFNTMSNEKFSDLIKTFFFIK